MLAKPTPVETPPVGSKRGFLAWSAGIAVAGIVVVWAAWPASRNLGMDRSIESLFAGDDPTIRDYNELRDHFGGNSIALLVYEDAALMTREGIKRNRDYAAEATRIAGVRSALSTGKLSSAIGIIRPQIRPAGGTTPAEAFDEPILRSEDKIVRRYIEMFAGYTHSVDQSHAAIVMILEPDYDDASIDRMKQFAERLRSRHGAVALVGEPVLLHDGFALIRRDGRRLSVVVLTLLVIVMLVSLGELRSIVLSMAVLAWAVVTTRALIAGLGFALSLISTVFTAVIMVVVVAAVMHMGIGYGIALRRRSNRAKAAGVMGLGLAAPVVLTCMTDAAGFAALAASQIAPVRHFGVMVAIGCVMVVIGFFFFAPLAYLLGPRVDGARSSVPAKNRPKGWAGRRFGSRVRRGLRRIVITSVTRPVPFCVTGMSALLVAGMGLREMKTETSFLNNFRDGSPIAEAYALVETRFGGAGVWDVILDAPEELSPEYLQRVGELQSELRSLRVDGTGLSKVISLADAESIASEVPLLRLAGTSMRLNGMRVAMPVFSRALASSRDSPPDASAETPSGVTAAAPDDTTARSRRYRIMLRSPEQLDAATKLRLIAAVESTVSRFTTGAMWSHLMEDTPGFAASSGTNETAAGLAPQRPGRVTGYYVLMARLVGQLAEDQWRCFAASVIGVGLILVFATRSVLLAAAVLIVNLIPVAIVLAATGFFGGKLNMGASMIGAVSIGLSIDGSIHLVMRFRRLRDRTARRLRGRTSDGVGVAVPGHDGFRRRRRDAAIVSAAGRVALPILFATLALVIGFLTMGTSDFVPTATFGMMVAASLVISMVTNLTVLPAVVAIGDVGIFRPERPV